MEEMKKEQIPQIGSRLRQHILKIPEAVFQASGIIINGRRIKSFVFMHLDSEADKALREGHIPFSAGTLQAFLPPFFSPAA